jgi:deoxycytidine triphosphate deaminase
MRLPDPLNPLSTGWRLLSDNGILQAMDLGVLQFHPAIDPHSKRIQPVSVDRRIVAITDCEDLPYEQSRWVQPGSEQTLPPAGVATVQLEDRLILPYVGSGITPIGPVTEARSSLRRLGPSVAHSGAMYFSGLHGDETEVINITQNPIHNINADYSLQTLIRAFPFFDSLYHDVEGRPVFGHIENKAFRELAEGVRALPMGTQANTNAEIRALLRSDLLTVSGTPHCYHGTLLVHAGDTAYRFRTLPEGIDFARRKEYAETDLLEPISLRGGYAIQPNEHIIIETKEQLELSEHVAIIFADNLIDLYQPRSLRANISPPRNAEPNRKLLNLIDGLVDPGYKGGFSRQPKTFSNRTIYPGDPIGRGIVFYFPQGTRRAYGDATLQSQYQDKKTIAFSA